MINDFNDGAVGWTDWNVLLDDTGGPNHVANFCYAPVIGFPRPVSCSYMNSYYYIGHFSKFVRPGAQRIISSSTTDNLLTTAFLNLDGTIVVVIMNDSDLEYPLLLSLSDKVASITSPAHSIMSVVIPTASVVSQR